MGNKHFITVEVIYLTPGEQATIILSVPKHTRVIDAIRLSNLLQKFPDIDLNRNKVGIFSKIVTLDTILQEGDRVEIYRPLLIDPKQKRLLKVNTRLPTLTPTPLPKGEGN